MQAERPTAPASSPLPIDLAAVAAGVRGGQASDGWMASWLPATWVARERFASALYRHAAGRADGPIKSRPEIGLNLYADCVTAQLGRARAALVSVAEGHAVELSYERLHERCSALASAWASAGVAAGASVAIVLPVGAEYAVALLCALRMGLSVTTLPPLGPAFVRNRLARIAPDHVVTSERFAHLLAPDAPPALSPSARGGDATLATSHSYAAGDVALRLFSPFCDAEEPPFELNAGDLHHALLRDSLLVYALEPGERMAAPGFDPLQWQPLGLLTALIAGAGWVELDLRELHASPALLQELRVSVLGIDTKLREHVLASGGQVCAGVRSWFRSLNDVFDYLQWEPLGRCLTERKQPGFCVLANAASGGAQLFSSRSYAREPARIWPAPGRQFVVAQVGAGLLPSIDETGVYTPLVAGEADRSLCRMAIAKLDVGWTLGGSIDPGPQARALPVREIAASAERHPQVRAASVVLIPGRWTNDARVVLLAFVADPDPETGAASLPVAELLALIRNDLGELNVPERVEVFALHPRWKDGLPNRAWCSSQYLGGTLTTKARIPLFATLSRLAWIFETT